jgi:phosphatidylinositol alpha-1,6-mannosyltransferase
MHQLSKLDQAYVAGSPPKVLFAAVGLGAGTGGTAELSRRAVAVLLGMQRKGLLSMHIHVLQGNGPAAEDDLLENSASRVRWFDGNRRAFAYSLLVARADVRLLDHVGLARILGLLPKPMRPRYLLFAHGLELWSHGRADYLRTAQRADLLIANSEYTARRITNAHQGLPEIRICWPGKDVPLLESMPQAAEPWRIGPHAMLIVGRLSSEQQHKGHDHLVEAMPTVLSVVPDAQLFIAGSGDDRERLERKARDLGIADSVVFTGWVDERQLHRLYERCALFVMPSEGDGFGIVFLEAMMHGKPCVGLKGGSAAEVFEDGVSGILVDREEREDMARRLASLLLDDERRSRMGQAALARYRALFLQEHYARRLESILSDYLRGDSWGGAPAV